MIWVKKYIKKWLQLFNITNQSAINLNATWLISMTDKLPKCKPGWLLYMQSENDRGVWLSWLDFTQLNTVWKYANYRILLNTLRYINEWIYIHTLLKIKSIKMPDIDLVHVLTLVFVVAKLWLTIHNSLICGRELFFLKHITKQANLHHCM